MYVALDPKRTVLFQEIWESWGIEEVPLIILNTPFRSVVQPLLDYIDQLQKEEPSQLITVVLPEFIPAKWWHQMLHNQTGYILQRRLHNRGRNLIVIPFKL